MGFLALAAALGGVSSPDPVLSVPASTSKSGTTTSLTSNSVLATVTGGQAPFTYSWVRTSGDIEMAVDSPSAASTTFTSTGLTAGETDSAVFTCTVTDALGRQSSDSITVTLERYATLTASVSPTSVSAEGNTATVTTGSSTCTAGGGSGSYSYAWTKVSGGAITAVSATSAASTFRGSSMTAGETRSATFRCDVTDTVTGLVVSSNNVSITVERYGVLSASASPTSVSGSGTTTSITSNSSTASPSGGSGSFSYAWEKVSGGAITAVSASNATSTFRGTSMASGETRTATFRCKVTDNVTGTIVYTNNVSITVTRTASITYNPVPGTYSSTATDTVQYTVTASQSVSWSWSASGTTGGLSSSPVSGGSGTGITFTYTPSMGTFIASASCTITLTSGGNTWTITLTANNSQYDPGGGMTMTL